MDRRKYIIEGMDCADCALKIEKGVSRLEGAGKVKVNFVTGQLTFEGDLPEQKLVERVETLGYRLISVPDQANQFTAEKFLPGLAASIWASLESRLALLAGALILVSFGLTWAGLDAWPVIAIQLVALALAGYPIARSAIGNLVVNHDFNMNFLMTVAAIGAVAIDQVPEAASLVFLFAISEALESYTTERARRSISSLVQLVPLQARRILADGAETVPVEDLAVGDRILVRSGDRIPMDGMIRSGQSQVNQAPITGESLPVPKEPGDEVFAGTINGEGVLQVEVSRLATDTTLSRIIRMVEEAQAMRAPTQRFVDRFAHYYTPAMMVLALLVAAVPPLFFGQPLLNPAEGLHGWLYRGLAMLVIGCPCALVLSTPVTVVSAIAAGARKGVLFKGGAFVEGLARIKAVAFDKTGTLTLGEPVVTVTRSVDCPSGEPCPYCDSVLGLAYSLEQQSSHPIAQAVVLEAQSRGLDRQYPPANGVVTMAGKGLQGEMNGRTITVGNHRFFEENLPHPEQVCSWVDGAESRGQTAMLVSDGERVCGYLAVSDGIRPESGRVVRELRGLGQKVALLSGDNPVVAQVVGQDLHIDRVLAGLLPGQKVDAIRSLQADYGPAAMVGDGINDAPALAAASIGIAMGGANSAQAMETADVVLMAEGLNRLPFALRLARFSRRLIVENIAVSLAVKLAFILLALGGWITLWLAVLADTGLSLLVTANGMRPLGYHSQE
jgi:Cd2+/Zn2+-exporting ATPase